MNPIIRLVNYMEKFKKEKPILYKTLYIMLWCAAPIEMLCIKLGLFGYKKYKQNQIKKTTLEELK